MSTYGRILREAFCYVKRYTGSVFIVHLVAPLHVNSRYRELIRDIALIRSIGINVICIAEFEMLTEEHFSTMQSFLHSLPPLSTLFKQCEAHALTPTPHVWAVASTKAANTAEFNAHTPNPDVPADARYTFSAVIPPKDIGPNSMPIVLPLARNEGALQKISSRNLAAAVAVVLKAVKLIYIEPHVFFHRISSGGLSLDSGRYHNALYLRPPQLRTTLQSHSFIKSDYAILHNIYWAVQKGVTRAHLLSASQKDALLTEICSHQGNGVMLYADQYEYIRPLQEGEVLEMLQLTRPLFRDGILRSRSAHEILLHLGTYHVSEIDGTIQGCVSLQQLDTHYSEIGSLAVHPAYRRFGVGRRLVEYCIQHARSANTRYVIAVTRKSSPWFIDCGFKIVSFTSLAANIQQQITMRGYASMQATIMQYQINPATTLP